MAKRYYWLKLKEDFFKKKEIKKLRKLENGDTCILIYMKMLILSLENDNKLFFDNVEDSFADELSLELDEDVDDVKRTLDFLEKVNFMEVSDDSEYFLPQGTILTGSECSSAERVRKHRAKKKVNTKDSEEGKVNIESNIINEENKVCNTYSNSCNENVTIDIEKDLDKDIEIDTDVNIDHRVVKDKTDSNYEKNKTQNQYVSKYVDDNLAQIVKLYEENIGPVYPANRDWFVDISQKIEPALFNRAIEICIDKSMVTPSYLKGIIRKWINNNIFTLDRLKSKEIEDANRNNMTPSNRDFSKNTYSNNSSSSTKTPREYEVRGDDVIDPELLEELKAFELKLGV